MILILVFVPYLVGNYFQVGRMNKNHYRIVDHSHPIS